MPAVKILWGSQPQLNETKPVEYEFDTPEELEAFLKGVDEASGWLDYDIINEDDDRCPNDFAELQLGETGKYCDYCDYKTDDDGNVVT